MDLVPPLPKTKIWKSKADFFSPFRSAAKSAAGRGNNDTITSLTYDPTLPRSNSEEAQEPDLRDLNDSLETLTELFPDVLPEVLREMLMSLGEESRLQVVTENLLRKKGEWVRGRWKTEQQRAKLLQEKKGRGSLREEEMFRSEAYKKAVKQVFYAEFKSLSRSTVRGVLAEQNFSYALARPILQGLVGRSWRVSLASLWSRKGANSNAAEAHPYVLWQSDEGGWGELMPAVRRTGSLELDHELHELFVAPLLREKRQERLRIDHEAAATMNESEAEQAEAMFECECCCSSVPFESIATCEEDCHVLCLNCIQRTVKEALYGQGWARAVDLHRCTLRCFASADCQSNIPPDLVRRALTQGSNTNEDMWQELQTRMTTETLLQSGLPLQRCPFCSYAEIRESPRPRLKRPLAIWMHLTARSNPQIRLLFLTFLLAFTLLPLPISLLILTLSLTHSHIPFLNNSLTHLQTTRLPLKFHCLNPTCTLTTCLTCSAPWLDPHTCYASARLSLRQTLETASTLAIKRTCPKCSLSFIKSSGCNKLVCNCGYVMCYICRSEISEKEGYAHFCQHFRAKGEGRCAECERCDLYGEEDEERVLRGVRERVEGEWREAREGEEGGKVVDVVVGKGMGERKWWEGLLEGVLDVVVE